MVVWSKCSSSDYSYIEERTLDTFHYCCCSPKALSFSAAPLFVFWYCRQVNHLVESFFVVKTIASTYSRTGYGWGKWKPLLPGSSKCVLIQRCSSISISHALGKVSVPPSFREWLSLSLFKKCSILKKKCYFLLPVLSPPSKMGEEERKEMMEQCSLCLPSVRLGELIHNTISPLSSVLQILNYLFLNLTITYSNCHAFSIPSCLRILIYTISAIGNSSLKYFLKYRFFSFRITLLHPVIKNLKIPKINSRTFFNILVLLFFNINSMDNSKNSSNITRDEFLVLIYQLQGLANHVVYFLLSPTSWYSFGLGKEEVTYHCKMIRQPLKTKG